MAELKQKSRYEELTEVQQRIVDLKASNPDITVSEISEMVDEINDDSTYPYQVLSKYGDIVDGRREELQPVRPDQLILETDIEEIPAYHAEKTVSVEIDSETLENILLNPDTDVDVKRGIVRQLVASVQS